MLSAVLKNITRLQKWSHQESHLSPIWSLKRYKALRSALVTWSPAWFRANPCVGAAALPYQVGSCDTCVTPKTQCGQNPCSSLGSPRDQAKQMFRPGVSLVIHPVKSKNFSFSITCGRDIFHGICGSLTPPPPLWGQYLGTMPGKLT